VSLLTDVLSDAAAIALEILQGDCGPPADDDSNDPIERQLAQIRTRRRWLAVLLGLFIPVVTAFAYLTSVRAGLAMAIVWGGFAVVMGILVAGGSCPRCGHVFGWNLWITNCSNCSLKVQ
jgi:hypothetical protein